MIKVSIIILSYNTRDLLEHCLASVFSVVKKVDFEVIVVDNASTDQSVAMVREKFPKVKLIENKENLGFGKGINLGAKSAQGEFLLFLNSDALLEPDISGMVEYLQDHSQIGIIGGKLVNADGSPQRSYGNFYNLKDVFFLLFGGERKELQRFEQRELKSVDWVSGGFMLIRKALFESIHGFDPHFFMYIEDMELCYRAKQHNFLVYFYPEARARHIGQGSSNRSFAIIHIYKGLLYFYKKHKSYFAYIIVKALLLVKALLAVGMGIMKRDSYLVSTYTKAIRF